MNICVFGASSNYIDEKYTIKARELGKEMAKRGIGLVFGGGNCGIMGATAESVIESGGKVLGVAPRFMQEFNVLYDKCTEFRYTETMAERKTYMEEHADAFIIAPGGIGTFEEFFEVYTLRQLGRHCKAIAVYNAYSYYDNMRTMLEGSVEENFLKKESLDLIKFFDEIPPMLDYIETYKGETSDTMNIRYNFIEK